MASIEKRGDSWRITVSITREDGLRKKHYMTVKQEEVFPNERHPSIKLKKSLTINTKTDVEAIAKVFEGQILTGGHREVLKMTVEKFLGEWMDVYGTQNLAASTLERYKKLIDDYVKPKLGRYQLEQIKAPVFLKLYRELQQDGARKDGKNGGLSGTTVLQIHRILHVAFETAVQWDYIERNPLKSVRGPRKNKPKPNALDEKQVFFMLGRAYDEEPFWFYSLITLAAISGLRRGEILALRWTDCDFNEHTIVVNQALQYIKGKGKSFKEPKTVQSQAPVNVPEDVMQLLEKLKIEQNKRRLTVGSKWVNNDLVFANWCGQPLCPDHVTHLFSKFMNRIGLPGFHLHNLRHTTASMLANRGEQAKDVSEHLRHATIGTTMNIYTKLFEPAKRRTADKLSGLVPKESIK